MILKFLSFGIYFLFLINFTIAELSVNSEEIKGYSDSDISLECKVNYSPDNDIEWSRADGKVSNIIYFLF